MVDIKNRKPGEPISNEKKRYIVRWSKLKGNSIQNASDHFGVPTSTINDWRNTLAGGKEFRSRGRPSYLDEEALKHVYNEAQKKYNSNATNPAGKHGIDGEETAQEIILTAAI